MATTDPLELLTTEQAAARTGLSANTLLKHRKQRKGIPWVKLGRTVRYRTADVEEYFLAQTVHPSKPAEKEPILPCQSTTRWTHPALRGGRGRLA